MDNLNKKLKGIDQCVGCGYCCIESRCIASLRLYRVADICPALTWDEILCRYNCDLMQLPGNLGMEYRKVLYAGAGCCSNLNSWRKDVKRRTKEINSKVSNILSPIKEEFQVFLNVLGRQLVSSDLLSVTIDSFISELKRRNYNSDEAERIGAIALSYMKNNQSSLNKGFMG